MVNHRALIIIAAAFLPVLVSVGPVACRYPADPARNIGGAVSQADHPAPTATPLARPPGVSSQLPTAVDQPLLSNQLSTAASPYLRSAATQPVFWQVFDERAFQLARLLDRPVLLDVGGTWCHWCRVMGQESYDDPTIATLINQHFVPIKVDADERPDLDRRYQQAAQLVAQESGWPLTLFLTSDGEVFAGSTYLPAQARADRAGLADTLVEIAAAYANEREPVAARAAQLSSALLTLGDAGVVRGTPDGTVLVALAESLLASFDSKYGGFGQRAKVPSPQAIELALQQYRARGDERYLELVTKTLDAMATGGIRDQLGGGFHRYSLDPRWQVPHFEMVSSLNAALAVTYLHAYQVTGSDRFRAVAEGTLAYLDRVLADRDHGGFYSSQAADVAMDDDGGYYTWTAAEISAALPADEAAAVLLYFGVPEPTTGIKPGAAMPGQRSVLYVALPVAEVARALGLPADQARSLLESGRDHLRAARALRPAPTVDRSLLADRNGTIAAAYFEAYRVLGRMDLRDAALRTIARLIALPRSDGLFAHVYVDGLPTAPPLLDDQFTVGAALIDAFAVTGEPRYLEQAGTLIKRAIAAFGDLEHGGFFDVAAVPGIGIASYRQRPFDDGTTLSGNPLAAITLDRYAASADAPVYRDHAEETLRAFAGAAREYGAFASGYALALSYHLTGH